MLTDGSSKSSSTSSEATKNADQEKTTQSADLVSAIESVNLSDTTNEPTDEHEALTPAAEATSDLGESGVSTPPECTVQNKPENLTVVRIGKLPLSITKEQLKDLVKPFGTVKKLNLITKQKSKRDKIKVDNGLAHVHFETRAEAESAIKGLHNLKYNNKILKVRWSKPFLSSNCYMNIPGIRIFNLPETTTVEDLRKLVDEFGTVNKCTMPEEKDGYARVIFRTKAEAFSAMQGLDGAECGESILKVDWVQPGIVNDGTAIKISNIPGDMTRNDLYELMKHLKPTNSQYLPKDKVTKVCLGYAIVKFRNKEEATNAITEMNGFEYKDVTLSVDWMQDSDQYK